MMTSEQDSLGVLLSVQSCSVYLFVLFSFRVPFG